MTPIEVHEHDCGCPGCVEQRGREGRGESMRTPPWPVQASRNASELRDAAIDRRVAEMNARIASCHERVACPKCGAEVGVRCWTPARSRHTKHPHRERWTLVVPAR